MYWRRRIGKARVAEGMKNGKESESETPKGRKDKNKGWEYQEAKVESRKVEDATMCIESRE